MERIIVTEALRQLGEHSHDIVIRSNGDVAAVYVNREYFGMWSFSKKTFID